MNYKHLFIVLFICGSLHAMEHSDGTESTPWGRKFAPKETDPAKKAKLKKEIKAKFKTTSLRVLSYEYLEAVAWEKSSWQKKLEQFGVLEFLKGNGGRENHMYECLRRDLNSRSVIFLTQCCGFKVQESTVKRLSRLEPCSFKKLKVLALTGYDPNGKKTGYNLKEEKKGFWFKKWAKPRAFADITEYFESGNEIETLVVYMKKHKIGIPRKWTIDSLCQHWKKQKNLEQLASVLITLKSNSFTTRRSALVWACEGSDTTSSKDEFLKVVNALENNGFSKDLYPPGVVYSQLADREYRQLRQSVALTYFANGASADEQINLNGKVISIWRAARKLGDTRVVQAMAAKSEKVRKQIKDQIVGEIDSTTSLISCLPKGRQPQLTFTMENSSESAAWSDGDSSEGWHATEPMKLKE